MCTIMSYTGTDMKHEKFAEALQRTQSERTRYDGGPNPSI